MKPIYVKVIILLITALLIYSGIWWWTTFSSTKPFNSETQQQNQKANIHDNIKKEINEKWISTNECRERGGKEHYGCPGGTSYIGTISDVKTINLFCCK